MILSGVNSAEIVTFRFYQAMVIKMLLTIFNFMSNLQQKIICIWIYIDIVSCIRQTCLTIYLYNLCLIFTQIILYKKLKSLHSSFLLYNLEFQ